MTTAPLCGMCGTPAADNTYPPGWDRNWACWPCLRAKVAAARGGQTGEAKPQ